MAINLYLSLWPWLIGEGGFTLRVAYQLNYVFWIIIRSFTYKPRGFLPRIYGNTMLSIPKLCTLLGKQTCSLLWQYNFFCFINLIVNRHTCCVELGTVRGTGIIVNVYCTKTHVVAMLEGVCGISMVFWKIHEACNKWSCLSWNIGWIYGWWIRTIMTINKGFWQGVVFT